MADELIIAELVAIRGIGRWTAEMFLIFHLMRPNVLPLDDVGLINGISQNYFSGDPVSRSDAREVAVAWAPYCSVATWYIWRSLDPATGRVLNNTGEDVGETNLPRLRAAHCGTRKQDRRTALCADRIRGRHLRRDRPARQEEPAAHQGHLQRPDALADHQDRAASGAPLHARLRERDLHGFRRAARRPPFLGRPVDRRRPGALQRHALHGARPPEGPRHQGAHRAQLRHEQARGLPQGAAPHEDGREVQAAGLHLRRHAGRLPGHRRRRARPVRSHRPQHLRDGAARGADHRHHHRRGRLRRRAGDLGRRPAA